MMSLLGHMCAIRTAALSIVDDGPGVLDKNKKVRSGPGLCDARPISRFVPCFAGGACPGLPYVVPLSVVFDARAHVTLSDSVGDEPVLQREVWRGFRS